MILDVGFGGRAGWTGRDGGARVGSDSSVSGFEAEEISTSCNFASIEGGEGGISTTDGVGGLGGYECTRVESESMEGLGEFKP